MGEQTLEFELLTCINMLNEKKTTKKTSIGMNELTGRVMNCSDDVVSLV